MSVTRGEQSIPLGHSFSVDFDSGVLHVLRFAVRTTLPLLAMLLVCSCASDVANRYYADHAYPPRAAKDVELLKSAPARPYEVIADFQSRGESAESLRNKAARIGADAIIVTHLGGRYDPSEEWSQQQQSRDMYTRIVGTAIKYK
jgi:hypothetical protein